MKRIFLLGICILFLASFVSYSYAQTGMMGSQQGQIGQGMTGEMPMMNCPMQQMPGQGMMQGGQPMTGQGMMGGMMGMGRERMGHHRPWFRYGVTLMLQNADKLGLSDEQIKKLYEIKRKYSKDIIKQDAELKISEIDLGALLKEPEINLSGVKEALKKVENARTQIRYLRIMAFVEARKILTDEQKNSLKKLMEMRPAPGMRGLMMPGPEEGEEETEEEGVPETDPHGH
ncbi:MAG: periplasmic heavy metal sensor [Nitrospirota bacterium]